MTEVEYGSFIVKIMETLKKSGYPENQVALPLEAMYEAAHKRGINFNKVLEFLASKEDVDHRKTDEKIIFFPKAKADPAEGLDFAEMAKMMGDVDMSNPSGLLQKAQELMKNMPPEQLQKMMTMFQSMSDEQKEEIIKKGKDMGLV